jgi:hypothetical protein
MVALQHIKSGVQVIETFCAPPKPYRLWNADEWVCPSCGVKVITGFGLSPVAEHWDDGFAEKVAIAVLHPNTLRYWFEAHECTEVNP